MHASNFQSRHQQQGIATVLIVVLLGLSLTITILVGLSNLRSSQELGVSMHTQTVTQQRAWSAAEALRGYLQEVTADYTDWLEFLDNFDLDNNVYPAITMTGFEGLQAQFIGVDDTDPDQLKISALVVAETAPGTRIASRSALEITFEVVPPVPEEVNPPSVPSRNVITFYDGLDVSGGIEVIPEAGKTYDVFVDGNVTLGNSSLRGMDSILSTMSISYSGGSGTNFNLLHASCDILVERTSDLVQHAKATNNICFDGGPASSLLEANGFVTIRGSGTQNAIWSRADVDGLASCASGAIRYCTGDNINNSGVQLRGTTNIHNVFTKGSIDSQAYIADSAVDWKAEKSIFFNGSCPGNVANLDAVEGVKGSSGSSTPNCKSVNPSVQVNAPIVQPVVLERESFDANLFRDSANYVYHRHNGATRVLVRNVDGIPDHDDPSNPQDIRDNGYYHRAARDTSVGWNRMVSNHACRTATSDIATEDENCWLLATANNITTNLPNFNNGNWVFNGLHHAPGIVFLDGGNVQIGQGAYTITFIATGNITQTTSNNGVAAPNFVGPDTRSIASANATFQGVCNNVYGLSPKDFCDGGGFNSSALSGLGNFALKAGSCPTNSPGMCTTSQYNGGDISISKPVLGVIKAGNIFSTSGDTRLQGYVSALTLRGTGTINRIGNRTVIDLSDLPEGYDPTGGAVDPGDGSGGNGNGGGGTEEAGSATLLWTRYL